MLTKTLESELFLHGNQDLLKEVYLELHPRSADKWQEQIEDIHTGRPEAFLTLLKDSKTRKGDFAQLLVSKFDTQETSSTFTPPQYLKDAIEAAVA